MRPALFLLSIASLVLGSCSSSSPTSKLRVPTLKMPKFKKPDFSRIAFLNPKNFSLRDLRAGKKIPIVEVRENDLKTVQTGEQLYLAYNKRRKQYGYYRGKGKEFTPIDFDPESLPNGSDNIFPTGGLLPSLDGTGAPVTFEGLDELPSEDIPDLPEELKSGNSRRPSPEKLSAPTEPVPLSDAQRADTEKISPE